MAPRAAATRSPITRRGRRSSRRRRCTARSSSPRMPACDPDRARLEPGQRRSRAPGEGRGPAGDDGDLPAPPAARPRRSRAARPVRRLCPALRDRALVERLWDSVLDGTADCLVSDHSAYTLEEKDPGWEDIFAAPLGCQVIQETVPPCSTRPTTAAACRSTRSSASRRRTRSHRRPFPRKGSLLPGADADIALYDLETEWIVDAEASSSRRTRGRRSTAGASRRGSSARSSAARPSSPTARSSPSPVRGFLSCHDDYSLATHLESRRRAES